MKPIHNVKLAFRCGEDLTQMSPCDGGRHCGICNKKVFDFTKSTQEEFHQAIAENGAVCGMFTANQMKEERKRWWLWKKMAASVFIAFGLCSWSKQLMAQNQPKDTASKTSPTEKKVEASVNFGVVEILPTYETGGDAGFGNFLKANLKNPDNVKGRVIVVFVIDTSGRTKDVKVLRGLSDATDKEVIRVIKLAKFKPGMQNGKKVQTTYSCLVAFTKNEEERTE